MPEFQFKDCYDTEDLAKLGIKVSYTGGSVDFSYVDSELNQSVVLARFGSFIYDTIKFASSFKFKKDFDSMLHDKFEILPIFKRTKFWVYTVDFKQATLMHDEELCFGNSEYTLDEFSKEFKNRLIQSLDVYKRKKEILKWKYNHYRNYALGKTPVKKFLFYLKMDPEMTMLPNGTEIKIVPIHEDWFCVKVMESKLVGIDSIGPIYETEPYYYIVNQKYNYSDFVTNCFTQEEFDILKSIG